MAVMGRSLGIPSRVVVGFLRPDKVEEGHYVYSAHDLHAWPEMYFDGTGWLRFEPTPQDRARSVPSYTNAQLGVDPTAAPSAAAPTRAPDDFDRPSPSPEAGAAGGSNGSGGIGRELLTGLLVLLGALGLAALPRAARGWVRRRRWASATTPAGVAEAAWAEVRASALDLGLGWDDSVTLRTRARSLAAAFGAPAADAEERQTRSPASGVEAAPEAARALERLVRYVERARYARAVEAQDGVEDDVLLVVGALGDGASRRRRLRATWWPTSLFDRSSSRDARRRRAASGSGDRRARRRPRGVGGRSRRSRAAHEAGRGTSSQMQRSRSGCCRAGPGTSWGCAGDAGWVTCRCCRGGGATAPRTGASSTGGRRTCRGDASWSCRPRSR